METLAHAVEPAVVKIYSSGLAPVENSNTNRTAFLAQQRSVGSGVIMDPQGYILTNAHVVQRARTLNVLVPDVSGATETGGSDRAEPPATAMPARVVGIDTVTDQSRQVRLAGLEVRRLRPRSSRRAGPGFWKSTGIAG
jgi:serine protease Do